MFLDEPTSGLSALDARRVTELLRGLADDGATIVLTIHQPSLIIYKMFDNVIILVPGGKVKNQRHRQPDEWKSRYNNSGNQYYQAFVVGRREQGIEAPPLGKLQRIRRRVNLKQWWLLTRHYAVIKLRDHKSLAMQLLMGPAIALGLGWVFRGDDAPLTGSLFMLVITSLWLGATSASGEIVGERAIYDRERMVNLKIPSYIFSKTAILSILGGCQSVGLLSTTPTYSLT